MTRRRVRFTVTAQQHVRRLKNWWQDNSSRPEILHDDLDSAVKLLSTAPGIGSLYPAAPIPGTRRFYIDRLMIHLYYTYDHRELVVRAVWHARRGSKPDLGS